MWSSLGLVLIELLLAYIPLSNILPKSQFWPRLVSAWAFVMGLFFEERVVLPVDRLIPINRTDSQRRNSVDAYVLPESSRPRRAITVVTSSEDRGGSPLMVADDGDVTTLQQQQQLSMMAEENGSGCRLVSPPTALQGC